MKVRSIPTRLLGLTAALALALGTQADAQERAGVVTTLEGQVTVTRASLPAPAPLKFKDDVFVRDRIATGRDAVARILLGGRALVTVREHSVVTLSETPGRSTVGVVAGRAAVAVARERMRPGDLVDVTTPNAVAGIRGTVVVAEVLGADRSVITVLKGVVEVQRLAGGPPTIVGALQRVMVDGRAPVAPPQRLTPDAARQLGQEFRVAPPRATPAAVRDAVNEDLLARAARDLAAAAPRQRATRLGAPPGRDDDPDDRLAPRPDRADRSRMVRERGGPRAPAAAAIDGAGRGGGRRGRDRD
jgi:hypothetical protein